MKIRIKGIGILLGVLFIVALTWWWFPRYSMDHMFNALGAQPTVAIMVEKPLQKIDSFANNKPLRNLLQTLVPKLDLADLEATVQDESVRTWIKRLAEDQVALAGWEASDGMLDMAGVSWLGRKEKTLKPLVPLLKQAGVEQADPYAGRKIWRYPWEKDPSGRSFFFALNEGLLLMCYAPEPTILHQMLERLDARDSSENKGWHIAPWFRSLQQQTKIWEGFAICIPQEASLGGFTGLFAGVKTPDATSLEIVARPLDFKPHAPLSEAYKQELPRFLDDAPMVLYAENSDQASTLMSVWGQEKWVRCFQHLMQQYPDTSMGVGLFGGAYSGSIYGLPIPSLIGWFKTEKQEIANVKSTLDKINDLYDSSFRLREIAASERDSLFSVTTTGRSPYGRMPATEQVGVCITDDWVIIGSRAGSIKLLVDAYRKRSGTPLPAEWHDLVQATDGTFAWLTPKETSTMLSRALKTYAIKLVFDRSEKAKKQQALVDKALQWCNTLGSFNHVYLNQKDDEYCLTLEMKP